MTAIEFAVHALFKNLSVEQQAEIINDLHLCRYNEPDRDTRCEIEDAINLLKGLRR